MLLGNGKRDKMPELPEVEVCRRGLPPRVLGHPFWASRCAFPDCGSPFRQICRNGLKTVWSPVLSVAESTCSSIVGGERARLADRPPGHVGPSD